MMCTPQRAIWEQAQLHTTFARHVELQRQRTGVLCHTGVNVYSLLKRHEVDAGHANERSQGRTKCALAHGVQCRPVALRSLRRLGQGYHLAVSGYTKSRDFIEISVDHFCELCDPVFLIALTARVCAALAGFGCTRGGMAKAATQEASHALGQRSILKYTATGMHWHA